MGNREILTKAIQKAIAGGWDKIDSLTFSRAWTNGRADHVKFNAFETGNAEVGGITFDLNTVIFNHDFAKALWGEERDAIGYGYKRNIGSPDEYEWNLGMKAPTWQLKLVQMVIADDPIAYLGENL